MLLGFHNLHACIESLYPAVQAVLHVSTECGLVVGRGDLERKLEPRSSSAALERSHWLSHLWKGSKWRGGGGGGDGENSEENRPRTHSPMPPSKMASVVNAIMSGNKDDMPWRMSYEDK